MARRAIRRDGAKPRRKRIATTIKNPLRVETRREQIFQAAVKLIRDKGYHQTTLRDISRASGISLGNLYDYISTKEDILFLVHRKAAEKIHGGTVGGDGTDGQEPAQKLRGMIVRELETIDRYQELVLSLYQETHSLGRPSLKAILGAEELHMGRFIAVLEEGMVAGVFREGNPVLIANLIKMMVDAWVVRRWTLRGKVQFDEMKDQILEFVNRTIVVDRTDQRSRSKAAQPATSAHEGRRNRA